MLKTQFNTIFNGVKYTGVLNFKVVFS